MKNRISALLIGVCAIAVTVSLVYVSLLIISPAAFAQGGASSVDPGVLRWGYLAAAIATGLSAIAAGIAVGSVGAAAVGAVAERPELFGRTLVLVGLAEGIAIYGLIISIMILNRLG
ncbi:MAG: ATP synthase subunit C [Gammaproteobacteria bacterium]|nr:ATP synthase subunit C [Gammaproteobacteria bacterium]